MEESDGSKRNFGFLSAPSDVLERVRAAQRVEIGFRDHRPLTIKLLAINNAGVALFAFDEAQCIRVTLSSGCWVAVVEGRNTRDVCIRAEQQLQGRGSVARINCDVVGADRDEAAAIAAYVNGVQISLVDPSDPVVSSSAIHALELARLDGYICKAEQLIASQRERIETLAQQGWPDDLPTRLLNNFSVSLNLLTKHRGIIQKELLQAD